MTKETNLTSFSGCILSHSYNNFHSFSDFSSALGGRLPGGYCVPFGWSGLFRCLGAQRPVARPAPGGGPAFFGRKPEERTPGRKRFFLPGPTFSGWGDPAGVLSFFCLACGPFSYARNGPPTGWAGWGRWFLRREGSFPTPKPSPWGEGGPAKPGRMRGRFGTQPFLVEVEKEGYRPSPQRNFSSAPLGMSVAPSSVTFGDSFPPRGSLRRWYVSATKSFLAQPLLPQNANPNQGTQMGTETAPPPEQCATTAKTSEWERAGHKKGGAGGIPPRLFASGLSLEKAWIPRPGPGGEPPRRG